jgi:phosphoribosylcarboxyaminoimidazole (NCAIR) mutase
MLAISNPTLAAKLTAYKTELEAKVAEMSAQTKEATK